MVLSGQWVTHIEYRIFVHTIIHAKANTRLWKVESTTWPNIYIYIYIHTGKLRRNQNPEQVLNQLHSDKENYSIGKPQRNKTAHLPTLSEELSAPCNFTDSLPYYDHVLYHYLFDLYILWHTFPSLTLTNDFFPARYNFNKSTKYSHSEILLACLHIHSKQLTLVTW
jgi:hypothetical protein